MKPRLKFAVIATILAWAIALLGVPLFAEERGGVYQFKVRPHGKAENIAAAASCIAIQVDGAKTPHFLTLAHVVDGTDPRVQINGQQYRVERVVDWETATEPVHMVRGKKRFAVRPFPIATADPHVGQSVWVEAFPQGVRENVRARIVAIHHDRNGELELSRPMRQGASGGGVFTGDGKLIGIIATTRQRTSQAINVPNLVARYRERSVGGQPVRWQCRGGYCYPVYCPPPLPFVSLPARRPDAAPLSPGVNSPNGTQDVRSDARLSALEAALQRIEERDTVTSAELQSAANLLTIQIDRLSSTNTELRQRVEALENRERVVILTEGEEELDRETYKSDEPIWLDLGLLKLDAAGSDSGRPAGNKQPTPEE